MQVCKDINICKQAREPKCYSLNILNTSDKTQTFRAVLFDSQGNRAEGFSVVGEAVPPRGKKILTSEDLEKIFDVHSLVRPRPSSSKWAR